MPSETLNTGFRRHLFTVELSPSGGEVFQSAVKLVKSLGLSVLIPMWWGGFSEHLNRLKWVLYASLNPHVVGRVFRVSNEIRCGHRRIVLIPMWWGGFSEFQTKFGVDIEE